MTTVDNIEIEEKSPSSKGKLKTPEFFAPVYESRTRLVGMLTVIGLLITGAITFPILIGLTPIAPESQIATAAIILNGILTLVLIFLIGKEIAKILRSRQKGRAASRLHVRIIGLFSLVAALPAILVAIVAGITLELSLDRWFEIKTKQIVESSVSVARAYMNESTRVLMGNTLSMAANLDRNRQLYVLDRRGFSNLFTLEARGRGFVAASLIRQDGAEILSAKLGTERVYPTAPKSLLEKAQNGDPVPIPPGNTNFVGAIFKLREIPNAYLYSVVSVQPAVINALRQTEQNNQEYNDLEKNRLPVQIAFAILYLGVCLIVLLCAIWMGMSVATRIVSPIRQLIAAADRVSSGDLEVRVDTRKSEGDLRFLSDTFNVMVTELNAQQSELISAKELMDQRARFIEAVLSGVSAAVIGVDSDGYITIANRSALPLLGIEGESVEPNQPLMKIAPELGEVFEAATRSGKQQHHEQITLMRDGRERTLNVQVTVEREETPTHSFVLTLDDITDLVSAQRNTAWADVARRIAHEIKNPLTPIQLSAERIKRRYGKQILDDDREVFDNCTETIIRQVSDIGKMVDEFSAFARMPSPEMAEGDLRKIVRETVFLQKVGFPDIEFKLEMDELPEMVFDSRMLSQALINVIKNAAEAIEAIQGDTDHKGIIEVTVLNKGSEAEVNIIDNGKGLPEANRQRLLEPYMTTREKGTGLGLAIVRKILEDHGGTIELMDAPAVQNGGSGAMMRFRLPMKDISNNSDPESIDGSSN